MSSSKDTFPGLAHLSQLREKVASIDYALTNPKRVLSALGDPQNKVPSVHITGTNGKGTVSSYCASILFAAGNRVAQMSSPHLVSVVERCLVDGSAVSEERFDRAIQTLLCAAESVETSLTFFELTSLAGFVIAAEDDLDRVVVEVGLGGRLDATNTMRAPLVTVITAIGLDHVHILGDTHGKIAAEKVQIFREGVPGIVGYVDAEARGVIEDYAQSIGAPVFFQGDEFEYDRRTEVLRYGKGEISLPLREIGLVADHQFANAALSARIALELGLGEEVIIRGLRQARWPGRLEEFSVTRNGWSRRVLTDGAHNEDGVRAFLQFLRRSCLESTPPRCLHFVISILDTKDHRRMLDLVEEFKRNELDPRGVEATFILTNSGNNRAVPAASLATELRGAEAIEDPEAGLEEALRRCEPDSIVVVTGSLYLLGRLRSRLTDQPLRTIVVER